jgi:TetR/AcrR family tetracycline transcriptional repressor
VALDRETVVTTALRLIDENGLEALTLRKLASELGVRAPALYWHVKNKRELLDLVSERLYEERSDQDVGPAPGQDWPEWIEERLLESRDLMLAHRDSALIAAGNRPTERSLPAAEATLKSLGEIGLPADEALLFLLSTGYYVIGGVLERQQSEARDEPGAEVEVVNPLDDEARFPMLAAAMAKFVADAGVAPDADSADPVAVRQVTASFEDAIFRYGAGLLIDGLRYRLDRQEQGPQERGPQERGPRERL